MKRIMSLLSTMVMAMCAFTTVVMGQPKGKPKLKVAVMPFKVNLELNNVRAAWTEELKKSGKVSVLSQKQVDVSLNLQADDVNSDNESTVHGRKAIGKALKVNYLLTGECEFHGGIGLDVSYKVTMKARLIDTSTGEVVWADEASQEEPNRKGVDAEGVQRIFTHLTKSCVRKLGPKARRLL